MARLDLYIIVCLVAGAYRRVWFPKGAMGEAALGIRAYTNQPPHAATRPQSGRAPLAASPKLGGQRWGARRQWYRE